MIRGMKDVFFIADKSLQLKYLLIRPNMLK